MKIKEFNTANLPQLRAEINSALEALGEKYDVDIKAGNASYSTEVATFKLSITTKGVAGEVETKEAKDFKLGASLYGMKKEDMGREVTVFGRKFVITGAKWRSGNPIIGLDKAKGKSFKLPLGEVKKSLGYV